MRVTFELDSYRPAGASQWQLPQWGHPLSMGVFPAFVSSDDTLTQVGTAFCVSKLGLLASALHVVSEALRADGQITPSFSSPLGTASVNMRLARTGLTVLHQGVATVGTMSIALWGVESVNAAPPTDLAFAFPTHQTSFPFLQLPMSFVLPRIGSLVRLIGYSNAGASARIIDRGAFVRGEAAALADYAHEFHVVEGRVTDIFAGRFAAGFCDGPCFAVDAEVPHGVSGGPALTAEGSVCGIVTAGASRFFNRPMTLVSPLYPALLLPIEFGARFGPLNLRAEYPLLELIDGGSVASDGSHESVRYSEALDCVHPRIHREDSAHVFDDFASYQAGRPATPVTTPVLRARRNPSPAG